MNPQNNEVSIDGSTEETFPIDFNTFVLSLGSSAAFHLGLAPHPEKKTCCKNILMAGQSIDILKMLQIKTSGNLTGEEERLLDNLVTDLETKYHRIKCECGCR